MVLGYADRDAGTGCIAGRHDLGEYALGTRPARTLWRLQEFRRGTNRRPIKQKPLHRGKGRYNADAGFPDRQAWAWMTRSPKGQVSLLI